MKVKIDTDVFAHSDSADKFLELQFILHIIFYGNRYSLFVDDFNILNSSAYDKLSDEEKEVINQSFIQSTVDDEQPSCQIKENGETEFNRRIFSPSESVMYLLQPLTILLENGVNDSHFIKALIRIYDRSGVVQNFISNNWLRFGNGGGCTNMLNLLKAQIEFFEGKSKFMKVYVLVDSDKRFPGDNIDKYNKLINYLKKIRIPYHVLSKRAMENYLPEDSFDSFVKGPVKVEIEKWKNAYLSLSAAQKDYLPIAEGLKKDAKTDNPERRKRGRKIRNIKDDVKRNAMKLRLLLPDEERNLYSDVGDGNLIILSNGFPIGNFKKEFPKAFNGYSVYKRSMEARTPVDSNTGQNELQQIVLEIKKLL